jgi:hypothetical protein
MKKNNRKFFKIINLEKFSFCLLVITVLIVNFKLNLIGSRFYAQDFIWNDYTYLEKIAYLKDSIRENIFSVINFSEGFGKNYISDLKSRHFILDPALYLSFFFNDFVSIVLKISIFQIISFFYFYRLLKEINNNFFLNIFFSYLFIFNLTFLSYEVSLTTNSYLLIAPIYFYAKCFINEKKLINYIFFCLFIFLFFANTDLNIIFIFPLLVIFLLNFNLKNLFERKYLILILSILIQFIILFYQPIIDQFFNNNYNYAKIPADKLYFYQIVKILTSSFLPFSFGPISLFYFPIIFIFVLKDKNNLKKIFLLYFLGILFYLIPLLSKIVAFETPALIRYHFFFVGFFSYILSIESFYKIKKKNYSYINVAFRNKFLLLSLAILFLLIIYFSFKKYLGFIIACLLISSFLILFKKKDFFKNKTSVVLLNLFFIFYIFIGQLGGFTVNNIKLISNDISHQIKITSQCLKNIVKEESLIFIVNTNYVKLTPGRDDFIMSLIERPSQISGRTYFQWRHTDHKITSLIYDKLGAHGVKGVNYSPLFKDNISKDFFEINKAIKNKYIATNFKFQDRQVTYLEVCKNNLQITKDEHFKKFNGEVFLKDIYLYKINENEKEDYAIYYNLSKIKIKNYNIKNKVFFIPINYDKNLVIKNISRDKYMILPDKNGVMIVLKNAADQKTLILTSYSTKLIFPYIINFFLNIISFVVLYFLLRKKRIFN